MNSVEQSRLKAANLLAETQRRSSEHHDAASLTRRRLELVDALTQHTIEELQSRYLMWVARKKDSAG